MNKGKSHLYIIAKTETQLSITEPARAFYSSFFKEESNNVIPRDPRTIEIYRICKPCQL